jgi:hypothetical protein
VSQLSLFHANKPEIDAHTVKTCLKCRYFDGISRVHPKSILVIRGEAQPGWYVKCWHIITTDRIPGRVEVPGAVDVDGLFFSYQMLRNFMRVNGHREVKCPRRCAHERD